MRIKREAVPIGIMTEGIAFRLKPLQQMISCLERKSWDRTFFVFHVYQWQYALSASMISYDGMLKILNVFVQAVIHCRIASCDQISEKGWKWKGVFYMYSCHKQFAAYHRKRQKGLWNYKRLLQAVLVCASVLR